MEGLLRKPSVEKDAFNPPDPRLQLASSPSIMSDSHIILGDRPLKEWIDRYEQSHRHPVNRTLHGLGIPMIAVSLPLFLIAPLVRGFWKIPLLLFTVGWHFQFGGAAVGGK